MFVEHEKRDPGINRESSHPVLDEASKLLLKAAAVIEECGWCQNAISTSEGMCAIGAIHYAAGEPSYGKDDCEPFYKAQKRMEGALGGHIHTWNDNPFRTKEEVVAKLRAVALGG